MKTQKFLFVPLVLLISFTIQAQTIDPESEWRVNYQYAAPDLVYNSIYRDFIDGDTIINSIEYYKIYNSGYWYYGFFPVGDLFYFDHLLHGFLREENHKWYTFYENKDTLLFDFNLDVNDTVYSAYTFLDGDPITISAIDSILIDEEYKRRLHLYCEDAGVAEYIIEGIGATSGLFENMWFFEWHSELVCYAKNGISVWGAPTEECDLAVKINEFQGNDILCSISPNPSKDFITLSIPAGFWKVKFTLINVIGGIVHQDLLESPSSCKINVNSYPSGIYLAIFESKSQRQTDKLLIE
jgi:hypothetical protein